MGDIVAFLGLQGNFPPPINDMSPAIRLSHLEETKWAGDTLHILNGRVLSRNDLEALIGRLNFAQSTTFNRLDRGMLKPLYEMLYAHSYCSALCPILRRALFWRYATLISLPPIIIADRKSTPDLALITVASYEECPPAIWIGGDFI